MHIKYIVDSANGRVLNGESFTSVILFGSEHVQGPMWGYVQTYKRKLFCYTNHVWKPSDCFMNFMFKELTTNHILHKANPSRIRRFTKEINTE